MFDNRNLNLPVTKLTDIAEILGIKGSKERKSEKPNFQDQDEDESYSRLVFYAHFDEDCDFIINRITNSKIPILPTCKFQSLTDGDPLSFEDAYGRKLKNVYSVTVTKGNLKNIFETIALENLKSYGFEFWFWAKDTTFDLLKNSENSFALSIVKNCLIFSLNQSIVFNDINNQKCKFSIGKWNHILLQMSKNESGEIYFNGENIAQFKNKFETRQLKNAQLLFLPVFEGETTEIRIWKCELDERRKNRSHQLTLPETFEKKFGKNIMFKQDRLRGKSQRSHSLIGDNNKSVESLNKGEVKKLSTIEGPKGSKMFISLANDGNTLGQISKKTSISSAVGPVQNTTKSGLQISNTIQNETNKHFNMNTFNLNEIMETKNSNEIVKKNSTLIKPLQSSIFKDYFQLLESEERELKESNISDLLKKQQLTRFIRVFLLQFMRFLFNDEFKEGLKIIEHQIKEVINAKVDSYAPLICPMVSAKLILSCFEQIGDKFNQEVHLDFVLRYINLMNYLKLNDKISMIISVRCLSLYIKAASYKIGKLVVNSIDQVSLLVS